MAVVQIADIRGVAEESNVVRFSNNRTNLIPESVVMYQLRNGRWARQKLKEMQYISESLVSIVARGILGCFVI
jgi:hypothetical protein